MGARNSTESFINFHIVQRDLSKLRVLHHYIAFIYQNHNLPKEQIGLFWQKPAIQQQGAQHLIAPNPRSAF